LARYTDKYAALTPQDQGKRAELVGIRFAFHRFSPFFCDFYRSKIYLKRSFSLLKNRTPACHLEWSKVKPKPERSEGRPHSGRISRGTYKSNNCLKLSFSLLKNHPKNQQLRYQFLGCFFRDAKREFRPLRRSTNATRRWSRAAF